MQPGLCSRNPASPPWLLTVKAERGAERHSHRHPGVALPVRLLLALRFFSKVFLTQECDRGVTSPSAGWSSAGPLTKARGQLGGREDSLDPGVSSLLLSLLSCCFVLKEHMKV